MSASKISLSIITPTIRPARLQINLTALQKQSFKAWEWIICAPATLEDEIKKVLGTTVTYSFLGNPPLQKGQVWDLNFSYNKLFKAAKAELIVSWQDSIWVPSTGLQQFWDAYQKTKGAISGVGDQYETVDEFGKPIIKIWSDPRKRQDLGSYYEINWIDCEWNWCCVPTKDIFAVGGCDENLDFMGYGGDTFQLTERLHEQGTRFWIDQSNESFTLRHTRERSDWDQNYVLFTGAYQKRKQELKQQNKWPILDFLKE